MRTSQPVAWVVGLAVGLTAFFTVGVQILFVVFYGMMHQENMDDGADPTLMILGSTALVISLCVWLAYAIQKRLHQGAKPKVDEPE